MTAEIERFIADLHKDPAFTEEIAARRGEIDAIVRIAGGRGYKFDRADVDAHIARRHLTDAQLDEVAAGKPISEFRTGLPWPW